MLRLDQAVMIEFERAQHFQPRILRRQQIELRAGAVRSQNRPHIFDLLGDLFALLIARRIRLILLEWSPASG